MNPVNNDEFPNIDTQYWQLDNKEWIANRAEQWRKIEPTFIGGAFKAKKAITIIKRYFLKGIMPDFIKLKEWNSIERHLDLFCFLWLHPSWDRQVLTELREMYVNYEHIVSEDIQSGVGIFMGYSTIMASQEYENPENVLHTEGHNELLFDVIMGDMTKPLIPEQGRLDFEYTKSILRFGRIITDTDWLINKKHNFLNDDCIYQYDAYVNYWYQCFPSTQQDYLKDLSIKHHKIYVHNSLYRIAQFDVAKEGDTCRSRYVLKVRDILDNRDMIPDIKDMWKQAKDGTIETKRPWKR